MIEGARRVGKSYIVEEFAKNEYESYIIVNFSKIGNDVKALFDDLTDIPFLTQALASIQHVRLYERKSLIVFDEIQSYPRAREAIKFLVEDGRYDYIETGSLISSNCSVPSMDFTIEEGDRGQMMVSALPSYARQRASKTLMPFFLAVLR